VDSVESVMNLERTDRPARTFTEWPRPIAALFWCVIFSNRPRRAELDERFCRSHLDSLLDLPRRAGAEIAQMGGGSDLDVTRQGRQPLPSRRRILPPTN